MRVSSNQIDPDILADMIGVRKDYLDSCTNFSEALVAMPSCRMTRHLLSLGKTGSGKSTAILAAISNDIRRKHAIILIDYRGDLVLDVLRMCAGRVPPSKVTLFDLRDQEPLGFNPMYGSGPSYFRALSLYSTIAKESDSWGVQLAETLRYALLILARGQISITNLERLLSDSSYRQSLAHLIDPESEAGFWQRYDALSPERQHTAFIAPVMNKISMLFATKGLRRMLGHQQPVDLGARINEPGHVILISLAGDELSNVARTYGNIFFAAILREVFARVSLKPEARVPTRMYVDELHNFQIDDFESVLVECRKFKMPCYLATQSVVQMSPRMRTIALGNVGAKLFFRTGREDSAVLSKDLTGDPKAIDFTALGIGEAIMWLDGEEPIHIECNEPLNLRDDQEFNDYLAEIRSLRPKFVEAVSEPPQNGAKTQRQAPVSKLEDWL